MRILKFSSPDTKIRRESAAGKESGVEDENEIALGESRRGHYHIFGRKPASGASFGAEGCGRCAGDPGKGNTVEADYGASGAAHGDGGPMSVCGAAYDDSGSSV